MHSAVGSPGSRRESPFTVVRGSWFVHSLDAPVFSPWAAGLASRHWEELEGIRVRSCGGDPLALELLDPPREDGVFCVDAVKRLSYGPPGSG